MIEFDNAAWLVLLPLALLPWWRPRRDAQRTTPWLSLVPRDGASVALDIALRIAASLALAATIVALAQPYRGDASVERIGRGAEIVFVFDRSSSMDEHLAGKARGLSRSSNDPDAKATHARNIIMRFVRERQHDAFALLLFSQQPMAFLPFTQKDAVMQSAIDAASIGRGLGQTDLGRGVLVGTRYFDQRPYLGSRILVLVSDGGAQLDDDTERDIASALRKHRIGVYWIYLRSVNGRKLVLDGTATEADSISLPEQSLHEFFRKTGVPYRPYDAESPAAIERALADLGRAEQQPIVYTERLPRRDFTPWATAVALAAVALLWAARLVTIAPPLAEPKAAAR